jgi:tetratricopeptide (TPR) repeat protein
LPLLETTDRLRGQTLGPDHPSTLRDQSNLASAYRQSGRNQDAIDLSAQALAGLRKKLLPTHPKIVWAINNLGHAYKHAGQADKALPLYQEVIDALTERYGPAAGQERLKADPKAAATAGNLPKSVASALAVLAKIRANPSLTPTGQSTSQSASKPPVE